MYKAKVVAHSMSDRGMGLASVEIEYPRKVLAEVVTHRKLYDTSEGYEEIAWTERQATRDLSKNSASSRAIPFARMLKKVMEDPYVPDKFSVAGPGMQAAGYTEPGTVEHEEAQTRWLLARDFAVGSALRLLTKDDREKIKTGLDDQRLMDQIARCLDYAGVHPTSRGLQRSIHKQDINRLLEPWGWITQIVTGDSHGVANWFALRCHADADPAFQGIARMAYLKLRKSQPKLLQPGQWHLPYVKDEEKDGFTWHPVGQLAWDRFPDPVVQSVARCAWLSYLNQDKDATIEACRGTFKRLVDRFPVHASPAEHQGTPMTPHQELVMKWTRSNLTGWLQARKLLPNEAVTECVFSDAEIASWGITDTDEE